MAVKKKRQVKRKKYVLGGSSTKRNYKSEYANYHGRPEQIKRRDSRNAARNKLIKLGKAKRGDGKDVSHRNGNPRDNRSANLTLASKSKNRSFSRTITAKKRNPYA